MNKQLIPGEYYTLKLNSGFYSQTMNFIKCKEDCFFSYERIELKAGDNKLLLFLSTKFLKPEYSNRVTDAEKFNIFLYNNQTICWPAIGNPNNIYKKMSTNILTKKLYKS